MFYTTTFSFFSHSLLFKKKPTHTDTPKEFKFGFALPGVDNSYVQNPLQNYREVDEKCKKDNKKRENRKHWLNPG